jgi:hypothetical protein
MLLSGCSMKFTTRLHGCALRRPHTKECPLSCTRSLTGDVPEFLCWKWKHTPELYSVGPDWFYYCFIYEKFVACREFLLVSE